MQIFITVLIALAAACCFAAAFGYGEIKGVLLFPLGVAIYLVAVVLPRLT